MLMALDMPSAAWGWYALNSEYGLISEIRLITRKYDIVLLLPTCAANAMQCAENFVLLRALVVNGTTASNIFLDFLSTC